ncbi:MAG: hypothetical protein IJQ68_04105 [Methanobrevibacter sp.]|uniref:hypothetical protein n=1 Tax=Methanobrevibacter sp. TaxID=66852 RepID=UPI0025DC9FBF|nr:hypothetical protein [Methanobrevibacter sp.]MBR0271160.1 hypothetical protein [Methanobrevibacter sp.]
MDNKILIILAVLAVICFGIFFFQMGHDITTTIVFNETEIPENGTAVGFLMDSYGRGVANQTVFYHQAGDDEGVMVNVTTDSEGIFKITDMKYLPESGSKNYYGDIMFEGYGEYRGCIYEYNLTVVH